MFFLTLDIRARIVQTYQSMNMTSLSLVVNYVRPTYVIIISNVHSFLAQH